MVSKSILNRLKFHTDEEYYQHIILMIEKEMHTEALIAFKKLGRSQSIICAKWINNKDYSKDIKFSILTFLLKTL